MYMSTNYEISRPPMLDPQASVDLANNVLIDNVAEIVGEPLTERQAYEAGTDILQALVDNDYADKRSRRLFTDYIIPKRIRVAERMRDESMS